MPNPLIHPTPPSASAHLGAPPPPFDAQLLDVGQGHRIHVEQCGNPAGLPVVFLHGGPGSGCSPQHRAFFNPEIFRAILLDQRACGRSVAPNAWAHNTSAHLIADLDMLRRHLGLSRWLVMGGSWGAGLGLAYAAAHPQNCLGLLLRGIFLGRPDDIQAFFQGMQHRLPRAWAALTHGVAQAARSNMLEWLHQRLHAAPAEQALDAALRWQAWEASVEQLCDVPEPPRPPSHDQAQQLVRKYQVQSHYLRHGCFWGDGGLLCRIHTLHHLPVALIHGGCDNVCNPQGAWQVHQRLPHSRLLMLAASGHNPYESVMAKTVVHALDSFAQHGHFLHTAVPDHAQETP